MLEYLSYISFFGLLIIFIIYLYIRLKFGFWAVQPVYHIYDISYMINPPGIIDDTLPIKNKYTNFYNIKTFNYSELTPIQIQRFINLIRTNYLQNRDNIFSPKTENIIPYFIGHNDKSFVSLYLEDYNMIEQKSGVLITDKKIVGVMTSRPINVIINNDINDKNIKFSVYYVDYLCIDKLYRKKGLAQQIIQTHHYNQRYTNKNIVISLFKREDELTGIVPLCVYSTYGFPVTNWTKPFNLSSEYALIEINSQNFNHLFNFIRENSNKFSILIMPEISNIIELIKTKNIYIYVIISDDSVISAYFFRKSCVQVAVGMEVLSCFASLSNTNDDIFIQGYKISFWKIANDNYFGYCAIEDISDNNIIIKNLLLKTKPNIISPTAYFFYNFAYPTFKSNETFIIN